RSLGGQFCSVCSQEYVLRLYRGGWGTPSAGIDLIEPGSESPSSAGTVNVAAGGSQVFSASVLRPSPDSVTLQWYVDGVAVPGANSVSVTFQPGTGGPATRTVELRATDATALVRTQMAGSDLVHRRTWNVQVASTVSLNVFDTRTPERDDGSVRIPVLIRLSAPAPAGGVSVEVAAFDGTATAGEDYLATPARVTIAEGQSQSSFDVMVVGDTRDEADETFFIRATSPINAVIARPEGLFTILDNDGNEPPAFGARGDRVILATGATQATVLVLENDAFEPTRLAGGSLSIVRAPTRGSAVVLDGTSPQDASDDRISYTRTSPAADDSLRYRLCEAGGRCSEAELQVVHRPVSEASFSIRTIGDRGYRDISASLPSTLSAARFDAHGLVAPVVIAPSLSSDPTPEMPFDAGGSSTALRTFAASSAARAWRVLVDARTSSVGDVDLYVGFDTNGNGQADSAELACTSATSAVWERCELAVSQAANAAASYWVLLHSRNGPQGAHAEVFEVPVDRPGIERTLAATGPGSVPASASFPIRIVWNDATLVPWQARGGWLEVKSDANTSLGWVPVRIDRDAGPAVPYAMRNGVEHRVGVHSAAGHESLYIDVPPGMASLDASTLSTANIDLYLARVDAPVASGATPTVAAAPPRNLATASAVTPSGNESLTVNNPAAGRWYVTPVNAAGSTADLTVRATLTGTGPQLRPGGFYNPQRSGNGLFLYPAGSQWAGLWYTYLQDGTTTWYYLQGEAPGATGVWRGTIFRSAWNGNSNFLTPIGEATVTPNSTSAFTYSYTLDGETGSEAYERFGGGCPTFAGAPLDASGHWFDPAKAGSGYSVQLFPNYEFYTVFGYDAQGVPRYLVAERDGIGAATQTLTLDQNTGACPLCTRTGNPVRATVGTLTRTIGSGTLQRIQLSGTFTAGVPGTWAANDAVIPLGSLQGCAAN
ncbi:MAG: Calx-beta domain-containing protein, partial [Silanimonas sp.]